MPEEDSQGFAFSATDVSTEDVGLLVSEGYFKRGCWT